MTVDAAMQRAKSIKEHLARLGKKEPVTEQGEVIVALADEVTRLLELIDWWEGQALVSTSIITKQTEELDRVQKVNEGHIKNNLQLLGDVQRLQTENNRLTQDHT